VTVQVLIAHSNGDGMSLSLQRYWLSRGARRQLSQRRRGQLRLAEHHDENDKNDVNDDVRQLWRYDGQQQDDHRDHRQRQQ